MKKQGAWNGVIQTRLTRESVEDLLSNRIAFICLPRFMPLEQCRNVTERFLNSSPPLYKEFEYQIVKTLQLGLMFTQMPNGHAHYLEEIRANNEAIRRLYTGGVDPLLKLKADLTRVAAYKSVEPKYQGNPLSTDLVWATKLGSCSPLHSDSYRTKQGPLPARFQNMFSWNLYLAMCEKGGELVLYRRFPRPSDDKHARSGYQWAYRHSVVAGVPRTIYRPNVGDMVIFNSGNYHEVYETDGPTFRTSAHSYISFDLATREAVFFI